MMQDKGYDVEILTIRKPHQPYNELINGLQVRRFDNWLPLLFYLKKRDPILVHCYTIARWESLFAPFFTRTVVFSPLQYLLSRHRVKAAIQRMCLPRFSMIFGQTPHEVDMMSKVVGNATPVRLFTLPIDYHFYATRDIDWDFCQRIGVNKNDYIVAYVGNLREVKQPLEMLEAFAIFAKRRPNAKLIIIGQNLCHERTNEAMRSIIDGHSIQDKVIFTGYLPPEYIRKILSVSHCSVVNSSWEGQCLAAYEIAAAGIPMTLSRLPVFTTIFQDVLYHSWENPQELADNFLRLAEDEAMRKRLAEANKERVREFDYEVQAPKLYALYQEVLVAARVG